MGVDVEDDDLWCLADGGGPLPKIELGDVNFALLFGLFSSFCTNMGMSFSSVPGSSSYRHRFLAGAELMGDGRFLPSLSSTRASSPPTAPLSVLLLLLSPPSIAATGPPAGGSSGTGCARDHSLLVLASKKPEQRVRVCRCSR